MAGRWARLLDSVPLGRDRPLIRYGGALLISLIALGLRLFASNTFPIGFPYIGFFPAIIFATFLFGVGPGAMAGIICGLAAWYFFIPPAATVKMSVPVLLAMGMYTVVVATNLIVLHWMQTIAGRLRVERERCEQLAARSELLFRELQHRVSNNLQVVGGLLALQKRDVSDPAAKNAIDEAARRLGLIGRIHRQLYDPTGAQLQLTAFLEQLTGALLETSGKAEIECVVDAQDDLKLPPDAAVPMALIVAEAVSNAIEHAFPGSDSGRISVRAKRHGTHVEVSVADDGKGLPADFDLAGAESLGLRLAQMLAMQLNGEFTMTTSGGTVATLRLPL